MSNRPPSQLVQAIEPVLTHAGFELVLCEFLAGPRILRLFIDRLSPAEAKADEGRVTVEDCSQISRLVSDIIDGEALMAAYKRFSLEVSSPGLDRPLVTPAHYVRFVGRRVDLRLHQPLGDLGRRVAGRLEQADDTKIALRLDAAQTPAVLTYDCIDRARLVAEL